MSNPVIFQLAALKAFRYSDFSLLANVRVTGQASFSFTGELAEQMTGPSLFPIETEVNRITTEGSINIGEYSKESLEFLMNAIYENHAVSQSTGAIVTGRAIGAGANIVAAAGGVIKTLGLSSTNTVKSGLYRILVSDKANKKVELYSLSSPDLSSSDFSNYSTGLIAEITLADGATTNNAATGLDIEAADTVNFDNVSDGDALIFRAFAPGDEGSTTKIGQERTIIPKVKLSCLSRTMSDGRWYELFIHNCIFPGTTFGFNEEFSANEVSGKLIYDFDEQAVATATFFRKAPAQVR